MPVEMQHYYIPDRLLRVTGRTPPRVCECFQVGELANKFIPVCLVLFVAFASCWFPTLNFIVNAWLESNGGTISALVELAAALISCFSTFLACNWFLLIFLQATLYEALVIEDIRSVCCIQKRICCGCVCLTQTTRLATNGREFVSFMRTWKGDPSIRQLSTYFALMVSIVQDDCKDHEGIIRHCFYVFIIAGSSVIGK